MERSCPHCGASLPASARFCGTCGAAIPDSKPFFEDCLSEAAASEAFSDAQSPAAAQAETVTSAPTPASRNRSHKHTAAIAGACGAVVLATGAVIVLVATSAFAPHGIVIDEEAFPDEAIRGAVLAQIDTDNDGVLSLEEQEAVTGLVFSRSTVSFSLNGETVMPEGDLQLEETAEAESAMEPEDTRVSEKNPVDEQSSGGELVSLDGLGLFPNLRTVVARDAGLTELDLSVCPNVEYVDCRNNSLASLNLASNANLTTLFCDEDTPVTGLEEAGLYFSDLVAGAIQTNLNTGDVDDSWVVEYDTFGRPLKVTTGRGGERAYTYDEQGRLTESAWDSSQWEAYEYGDNGLLSRHETFFTLDVDSTNTWETAYGYAEDATLAQTALRFGGDIQQRRSFSYEGRKPTSLFAENLDANGSERTTFEFDTSGHLVNTLTYDEESGFQSVSEQVVCEYSEQGALSSWNFSTLWNAERGGVTHATEYDDAGMPLRTDLSSGNPNGGDATFDYECNNDGYVTWLHTWKPDYDRDTELEVSYIKMIGSLEDRPARRYIPHFTVGFGDETWVSGGAPLTMGQEWYQDTSGSVDATVLEMGPAQAAYRAMGLMPLTLANSNERMLATYDAEHWVDGLALSGASLIFGEESEVGSAGDSGDLYDVQTEDFAFNLPDSWQGKVDITYDDAPDSGFSFVNITLKDEPSVVLLTVSVGAPADGDSGEFDLSLPPRMLDDGRRISLAAPAWGAILMDAMENGYQASSALTTKGQWKAVLELTLGDGSLYDSIVETPYNSEAVEFLMDVQQKYLTDEIANKIALA